MTPTQHTILNYLEEKHPNKCHHAGTVNGITAIQINLTQNIGFLVHIQETQIIATKYEMINFASEDGQLPDYKEKLEIKIDYSDPQLFELIDKLIC